jgi:hypothetical protein
VCESREKSPSMGSTVLALKFVHHLGGKKATLIPMPDDLCILVYEKARGSNSISLAIAYLSVSISYSNGM